jgi:hypothetical protein
LGWLEIEASVISIKRGKKDAQIDISNTLNIIVAVEGLAGKPNGILCGPTGVS